MITIRCATHNDVNTLNDLISLSARELSKGIYTAQEIESGIQYIFGVDTELLTDQTYYVIEHGSEIAGCGGWSMRKTLFGGNQFAGREDSIYLAPEKDPAKIRAFFIHPGFARRGLGSMLLEHCEQAAWMRGYTTLEMMATLPGVKLYEKLGYRTVTNTMITLPNQVVLPMVHMLKNKNA